uniref:Uncharacterized protein n=1 Tax=Wuchereria bancrofti TaxID=6293 RepID=A0AAF5PGB2_WUCBA
MLWNLSKSQTYKTQDQHKKKTHVPLKDDNSPCCFILKYLHQTFIQFIHSQRLIVVHNQY